MSFLLCVSSLLRKTDMAAQFIVVYKYMYVDNLYRMWSLSLGAICWSVIFDCGIVHVRIHKVLYEGVQL